MGDIGEPRRRIDLEPFPEKSVPEPRRETPEKTTPSPAPATAPTPA